MLRGEDEDTDARAIETPTHSQSSKRRRKQHRNHSTHNSHNSHNRKEVDGAAEHADGAATMMPLDPRSPILPRSSSCLRLYRRRRIAAGGVDVGQDEVDAEEAA
jgi:hypothetical protein